MTAGVYKITNKTNGKFYIGQSVRIERRWKDHFANWNIHSHSPEFQEAIRALGPDGFEFEILEECAPADLKDLEARYIAELKPEYNSVYEGHEVGAETRAKISRSLTGRKPSPEIVERRRLAILERHKSIPQTNAGHRKVCVSDDGTRFESVKAAAEFYGVHPSTVTQAIKRRGTVRGHRIFLASVETTRDECSGVGPKLSYGPKCTAAASAAEDIVHSGGMGNRRAE